MTDSLRRCHGCRAHSFAALLLVVIHGACNTTPQQEQTAPSAIPVDHLGPQEPGSVERRYMGFRPPEGMRLDARFPLEVHLVGTIPRADAAAQIRDQVIASHVELEGENIVFPRATLKGGDPKRPFRITVSREGSVTRVRIQDETTLPAPGGMSQADRYKKAGISPNGRQLDTRSGELQ